MISVKNLNKSFRVNGRKINVLKNVNFELKKGDSLAIIGSNGSGKTTLINLLAGFDRPDSGVIHTNNCKISWPIGLGAGFQGSLTAKENVIFVAKIFTNNNKKLINEKISIVKDFAEIGEFFDRPVKTYSQGMRSRLSFALSIAFKFDLYLLDEITAAGDMTFKNKCKLKLEDLRKNSDFIYVSHNLAEYTSEIFNRAAIIENGHFTEYDTVQKAIDSYRRKIRR